MLTREFFEQHVVVKNELGVIETKINNRVGEILTLILKAFNKEKLKFSWAYHYSKDEGGGMNINWDFEDDEIPICWWFHNHGNPELENRFWDYTCNFPGVFLRYSDSEILSHIKHEIQNSKELDEADKIKKKEQAEKKKEKIKEAASKLSPADRKLLGIKIK